MPEIRAGAGIALSRDPITDILTVEATGDGGGGGSGGLSIDNSAYDATTWDGEGTIAPSKNALRDKFVAIDALVSTALKSGVVAQGALPAGTNELWFRQVNFTGAAANASRADIVKLFSQLSGTNGLAEHRPFEIGSDLYHTGGDVADSRSIVAYNRLGLAGSANLGTAGFLIAFDGHNAIEGNGNAQFCMGFNCSAIDLDTPGAGTGKTLAAYGFRADNQGHASKVTSVAAGFVSENMTAGAPTTIGFISKMTAGTGKWGFGDDGGANNYFVGKVKLGEKSTPSVALDVKGYARFSNDGTYPSTANTVHEFVQSGNTYGLRVHNKHASAPNGIRISYTASPNAASNQFVLCEDGTQTKFVVWSNGNAVNANNSYGAISDAKLKTGIRDATPQLDDIRRLRVRKYRLKADPDGPEQIGLIAQEVQKVSPGLVASSPDYETYTDKKGNERRRKLRTTTKSVNYSILYMKAVKALQELAEIVEQQGKEIEALKAKA
ncbi:MAG TPA: tail fiber domain-containing protein [Sphingomicrobium sp.]|jgi:hypothetical protein